MSVKKKQNSSVNFLVRAEFLTAEHEGFIFKKELGGKHSLVKSLLLAAVETKVEKGPLLVYNDPPPPPPTKILATGLPFFAHQILIKLCN